MIQIRKESRSFMVGELGGLYSFYLVLRLVSRMISQWERKGKAGS